MRSWQELKLVTCFRFAIAGDHTLTAIKFGPLNWCIQVVDMDIVAAT